MPELTIKHWNGDVTDEDITWRVDAYGDSMTIYAYASGCEAATVHREHLQSLGGHNIEQDDDFLYVIATDDENHAEIVRELEEHGYHVEETY